LRHFEIPATLQKSAKAGDWIVGGVASSFHRDLDGEAITPDAIASAIPQFMAVRGGDQISGGPIRLHHDFWTRFLKQAIAAVSLPFEEQTRLISAIALPLGRVTHISVDRGSGETRWRGVLSQSNPIARIVWDMLREGLISLGVSVGGKILATGRGRDALGRNCTLITKIRLDELSITDNPALRLTEGEGTGAYITALAKSIKTTFDHRGSGRMSTRTFLRKALGGNPQSEAASGNTSLPNMGFSRNLGEPKTAKPKPSGTIKTEDGDTKTGVGGVVQPKAAKPKGGADLKSDVWGISVKEFAQQLSKCSGMKKTSEWSDPKLLKKFAQGAYGLTHITDNPPPELIDFINFLQQIAKFAYMLPNMDDYQAAGTMDAMGADLQKSLEEFQEKMPDDLMGKPLRPPTFGSVDHLDIVYPQLQP
jgi:hypothetical protein